MKMIHGPMIPFRKVSGRKREKRIVCIIHGIRVRVKHKRTRKSKASAVICQKIGLSIAPLFSWAQKHSERSEPSNFKIQRILELEWCKSRCRKPPSILFVTENGTMAQETYFVHSKEAVGRRPKWNYGIKKSSPFILAWNCPFVTFDTRKKA